MATFNDVMAALLSERGYQDSKWEELDKKNTFRDYLMYIEKYFSAVLVAGTQAEQLEGIRKMGALCVKVMEQFGAPQRDGFKVEITASDVDYSKRLDDTDLDELIKNEQEAVKIERGKYYRVNESWRTYCFDDLKVEHTFHRIRAFCVMEHGGHRLIDDEGTFYYVHPGWTVLEVKNAEVV